MKNTGIYPHAHTHPTCHYTLSGIKSAMTAADEDTYHTGHTDGSLGGFFDVQPNGTLFLEDVILESSVQVWKRKKLVIVAA